MSFFRYPQKITYWAISSVDGNGDKTYSAGVVLSARIKEVNKTVTNDKGEVLQASHFIYTEWDLPRLSLVVLSDMDGVLIPPDGARKIIKIIENNSMSKAKKVII